MDRSVLDVILASVGHRHMPFTCKASTAAQQWLRSESPKSTCVSGKLCGWNTSRICRPCLFPFLERQLSAQQLRPYVILCIQMTWFAETPASNSIRRSIESACNLIMLGTVLDYESWMYTLLYLISVIQFGHFFSDSFVFTKEQRKKTFFFHV